MLTFILGLLTGGFATAILVAGIYGMYMVFAGLTGWLAVLIFICAVFCLLFGYHMTKIVGQAVQIWNVFNKTKERLDVNGKETEKDSE